MLEIVGGLIVLTIMVLMSGIKVVKDSNRLVVYRAGKVVATKGAGVHLIVPILESAETVDTRMMMLDTPVLAVTTLDGQGANISAACMFQIGDAKKAVTKISNAAEATATMAATVLRNVAAQNDLKTLQNEQKGVNKKLKMALEKQTREWGINIKSIEIKTLTAPADGDLQALSNGNLKALPNSDAQALSDSDKQALPHSGTQALEGAALQPEAGA